MRQKAVSISAAWRKFLQRFWSLTNLTRMSSLTKWMSSMYRKPIRWRFISKTAELSQKIVRTLDTRSAGRLNIVKEHQNSGENTAQIKENALTALDQTEYQKRYDSLTERYNRTKEQLDAVTSEIDQKELAKAALNEFQKALRSQEELLPKFDVQVSSTFLHRMVRSFLHCTVRRNLHPSVNSFLHCMVKSFYTLR